jgi:hypothetical protein
VTFSTFLLRFAPLPSGGQPLVRSPDLSRTGEANGKMTNFHVPSGRIAPAIQVDTQEEAGQRCPHGRGGGRRHDSKSHPFPPQVSSSWPDHVNSTGFGESPIILGELGAELWAS